jgi:hypothetical protein
VLLGAIALFVALGPAAGFCAIVLLAAALALLAWLCIRQFAGQTGDVLGAVEQLGEIAICSSRRRRCADDADPRSIRRERRRMTAPIESTTDPARQLEFDDAFPAVVCASCSRGVAMSGASAATRFRPEHWSGSSVWPAWRLRWG